MSIVLFAGGFAQAPPTLIWYIAGVTQLATIRVSVAEAACPLLGVTLFVDRLQVIPDGEPGESATGALNPLTEAMLMVTLVEPPGVIEMDCGEADMRKSGPAPEVMVKLKTALVEGEVALTAKLPPGISTGMVTTDEFQVPLLLVCPVAMVCPTRGPASHLRVMFSVGANLLI
jgi:hypothetical protein